MKTVNFLFSTKLTFDDYVHGHSFALRIIPPDSPTQNIISCSFNLSPLVVTRQTVDAFGNNVTCGYVKEQHRFLDFEIKGTAEIDCTAYKTDYMPCYLYQSEYTVPDKALKTFYEHHKAQTEGMDVAQRVEFFCQQIYEIMRYQKDVTTTKTTAAEAFALKQGVCQDFPHILISVLRSDGIAARYIAGLAFCDGETHSWVEYWTGDHWEGIDPANNCKVNEYYLVLSQGRDFHDCAIDRGGMFGGYTRQLLLVRSVMN